MTDVDLGLAGGVSFQPGAESIPLRRRIKVVEKSAHSIAQEVLPDLCAILGPVGFHHARLRALDVDNESELLPKLLDVRPQCLGRGLDHHPALRTGPLDSRVRNVRKHTGIRRARVGSLLGEFTCGHRRTAVFVTGNRESGIPGWRCQIRRYFKTGRFHLPLALVVDLVPLEQVAGPAAAPQQHQGGQGCQVAKALHEMRHPVKARRLHAAPTRWLHGGSGQAAS